MKNRINMDIITTHANPLPGGAGVGKTPYIVQTTPYNEKPPLAFLRFQDIDIKQNMNLVIHSILSWITLSTHPCPSQEGNEGIGYYKL
jgi:hypothetical protein